MEAGADTLVMHLCEEAAPENQKFVLQEVSGLSFLPCHRWWAAERSVRQLRLSAAVLGVPGVPPCTEQVTLRCGRPAAGPVSSVSGLSFSLPVNSSQPLHRLPPELQQKWEEDLL